MKCSRNETSYRTLFLYMSERETKLQEEMSSPWESVLCTRDSSWQSHCQMFHRSAQGWNKQKEKWTIGWQNDHSETKTYEIHHCAPKRDSYFTNIIRVMNLMSQQKQSKTFLYVSLCIMPTINLLLEEQKTLLISLVKPKCLQWPQVVNTACVKMNLMRFRSCSRLQYHWPHLLASSRLPLRSRGFQTVCARYKSMSCRHFLLKIERLGAPPHTPDTLQITTSTSDNQSAVSVQPQQLHMQCHCIQVRW